MNLTLSVTRPEPRVALVEVAGEIDVVTTPQLRAALYELADDEAVHTIVVDLDGVEFIDSSGLGALIGAGRQLRSHGADRQLRIACTRAHLLRVFEITELDGVFPVHASVPEALSTGACPPPDA